jgi:hypothetical protein
MLIAGVGLGAVLVGVAVSVLTGARDDESGMLSGLNTTGHEVGGSFGVAVLATIATSAVGAASARSAAADLATGIGHAFLAAGLLAAAASMVALAVLPSARSFLPKLQSSPSPAIH